MVDIKREDITLQDWTKGISADEFAGGSYFYAEGIQTGYNTKGFKLGHKLSTNVLNYRTNGYPVAMSPAGRYGMTIFTHDRRLETSETFNGSLVGDGDDQGGGALYASLPNATSDRINGITYGTNAIIIERSRISVIDRDNLFNPGAELLTQPKFESGASDRTIGTGWSLTSEGMEHTAGQTGTLTTTFNNTAAGRARIAVKVKDMTQGKITIDAEGLSADATTNGWFVMTSTVSSPRTYTLTITPSSTFDGTVEMVNVHEYDTSKIKDGTVTITTADSHPCVIWGGDLYIGSGNKLDIVSLSDRGVITKSIVDENETIVDISPQAGNLIIWTTDGYNSRQYYWNGVDAVATEAIEWKGLIVKAVTNTETVCYVLTTSGSSTGSIRGYQYRLYAVSGYQRNLLACKTYYPDSSTNINQEPYNPQKKFDFNDVSSSKSMTMFLDSLFIPGCDGIYKYGNEIPGMRTVWSRPIRYPFGSTRILLGQRGVYFAMCYTLGGINYYGYINEQKYTESGYIVSESIYRDKLSTRKALEKLKIGYKNVASEDGNIKVYAIVDDDYFWRFTVSGVTNRPSVGDVYTVANQTKAEVIDVDQDNNLISFRTIENYGSYNTANSSLTKVSGDGDATITTTGYDNMILVKTIQTEQQGYGADLIFGKNFVSNYIPYWHKIQFVVELNSIDNKLTPEIYEISMVSDITDVVL